MVLKTRSADWLRDDYYRSIRQLAQMGTDDILSAEERSVQCFSKQVYWFNDNLQTLPLALGFVRVLGPQPGVECAARDRGIDPGSKIVGS